MIFSKFSGEKAVFSLDLGSPVRGLLLPLIFEKKRSKDMIEILRQDHRPCFDRICVFWVKGVKKCMRI